MLRAMRIGRWAALLAVGAGVLLATAPAARADLRDRVQEELQRTDGDLERARGIVQESSSQRAQEALELALQIQRKAWDQYRGQQRMQAGRLTLEARQLALRAITLAREDSGLRNRARRELDQAAGELRRAREEIGPNPGDQAIRLLEEARAQIDRGQVQFHEQHYEAAFRLAVSARRLIRQATGSDAGTGSGRVQRELDRTDRLIERVGPAVRESGNEEAIRLLRRGVDLQAEAWQSFRDGQPRLALATTREAREVVGRAHRLVRGPVDPGALAKALQETERVLERAADIVTDSGDEHAVKLMEKAREHQRRAHRLAENDQPRPALAETRVARSLALRAIRIAQDGGA